MHRSTQNVQVTSFNFFLPFFFHLIPLRLQPLEKEAACLVLVLKGSLNDYQLLGRDWGGSVIQVCAVLLP